MLGLVVFVVLSGFNWDVSRIQGADNHRFGAEVLVATGHIWNIEQGSRPREGKKRDEFALLYTVVIDTVLVGDLPSMLHVQTRLGGFVIDGEQRFRQPSGGHLEFRPNQHYLLVFNRYSGACAGKRVSGPFEEKLAGKDLLRIVDAFGLRGPTDFSGPAIRFTSNSSQAETSVRDLLDYRAGILNSKTFAYSYPETVATDLNGLLQPFLDGVQSSRPIDIELAPYFKDKSVLVVANADTLVRYEPDEAEHANWVHATRVPHSVTEIGIQAGPIPMRYVQIPAEGSWQVQVRSSISRNTHKLFFRKCKAAEWRLLDQL